MLVDEAVNAGDVDREAAARELAEADRELAAWKGELDGAHQALVLRRGWAQARLDAASPRRPRPLGPARAGDLLLPVDERRPPVRAGHGPERCCVSDQR